MLAADVKWNHFFFFFSCLFAPASEEAYRELFFIHFFFLSKCTFRPYFQTFNTETLKKASDMESVMHIFDCLCSYAKNFDLSIMTRQDYAPVICNPCPPPPHPPATLPPPHLRRWTGDSGANVRSNDLLSSPAVPGKCRACDIT